MNKYYKNFILCGDIDHHCLICQETFHGTPDVEKHIRWEQHRKSIKNLAYFPKFRKDFIYKVANNFYCEVCNLVVSTNVGQVAEHVKSDHHKCMKNNTNAEAKNFIGQYESGYIVIKKVILNLKQWNSIVDGKCLLCNIDVQYPEQHIALEDHIIKLIQSETKYEDDRYYRKINEDKYHCFTCKQVFSAQNFNDHWPKCENFDVIEIKKLKEAGSSKKAGINTEDIAKMADLEKKLVDTLQEFYHIDEKNNSATCKYCSIVVAINFKTMITHMKDEHNKQESKQTGSDQSSEEEVVYREVPDHGKRRSELAAYGRKHSIKLNHNGSKGWCLLCDKYICAHKKNFKEHTRGGVHRGHLILQGLAEPQKDEFEDKTVYKSKSIFKYNFKYAPQEKTFWVNGGFSIDVYSVFFIRPIEKNPHFKKTKCFACNELFPQGEERVHCASEGHKNKFLTAKVLEIGSEDEAPEFVREVQPNLFHCGYCNHTFPFMQNLQTHFSTHKHLLLKEEKAKNILNTIEIRFKSEEMYINLMNHGFGTIA